MSERASLSELEELSAEELAWTHALDLSVSVLTRARELGWSKGKLAEAAGMKPTYLSRVLAGKQNMTLETIARLEKALGVRFDAGFRYQPRSAEPEGASALPEEPPEDGGAEQPERMMA